MIPELETERMWLRPVRLEDAESRVQSRVEVLSGRSRTAIGYPCRIASG